MGFLDGFLDPTGGQEKAYKKARKNFTADTAGASSYYDDMLQTSGAASGRYADALGLNGTGAQQSFQDSFLTGPAYDANLAAGTAAIDQSAVAGGSSQSGNTLKALQQYGQNQYANEFNTYLDRLNNLGGQGYGAAAGQTGISSQIQNYRLGQGQAVDQGNAVMANNIASLAGWGAGRLGF
jgi:hypothetical protein